ncbi:MAG TPA: RNA methyltransferase [Actinocatenispora sp.]
MAGRQDDAGQARSPKDTFITVYGRMPVLEVLQDRELRVDKLVVADSARGGNLERILAEAARQGVPVRSAPAQRVKLLAGNGKHDQGIIADVVAPRMRTLNEFVRSVRSGGRHDVLVLDGVNNPANVGMIIRTATAAGVSGVVLPRVGSPDIDPLVIKASAGVAFRASIVRCRTAAEAVRELSGAGFRVHGLSGDGSASLYRERFGGLSAFVLGNETEGVSRETAGLIDRWVSIPMAGGVESLNVASAAAVLCFDLVRRAEERADAPRRPGRQLRGRTSGR